MCTLVFQYTYTYTRTRARDRASEGDVVRGSGRKREISGKEGGRKGARWEESNYFLLISYTSKERGRKGKRARGGGAK